MGSKEVEPFADGYRLSFPATRAWRGRLRDFTAIWREGYPSLRFDLDENSTDGRVRLVIRGPDGTREWIDGAREMLASPLNPAPTSWNRVRLIWRFATSPIRVLPDFLILGAMKSGTTSLYSHLIEHPRVRSAYRKEISYFDAPRGAHPLRYRAFFPTHLERLVFRLAGRDTRTGEATPGYLYAPDVPARVRRLLPDVRCIAILRNPIDRAYSLYNHNRRSGVEHLTFEGALQSESERLAPSTGDHRPRGVLRHHPSNYAYVSAGIYADQIERWHAHISAEQLIVVTTEELQRDPQSVLRQVLAHLDLPYVEPVTFRAHNAAPYPAMSGETRAWLQEQFDPHNRRLEELLGRRFDW